MAPTEQIVVDVFAAHAARVGAVVHLAPAASAEAVAVDVLPRDSLWRLAAAEPGP